MIYIHAAGIHNALPEGEQPDLKEELKRLSGMVYRRIDHFIQLAILGAHKSAEPGSLDAGTAMFMTSGQGNVSVFDRMREQRYVQKQLPKPVDFINMLSNSAGFYVASHMGLGGKNLFLSHHRFPVQMALLAARTDLQLGRQNAVLVGGVDEWVPYPERSRKLLGVPETTPLGEGSNWLLLNAKAPGALATLQVDPEMLDAAGVDAALEALPEGTRIAFSLRFAPERIDALLARFPQCRRYAYESACGYYETLPLYVLARFASEEPGSLVHLDVSQERYMIMRLERGQH